MQYGLRYPFVREFAGFIKKHDLVYICHHLLTADSGIALMPSTPLSGGLTSLLVGTTANGQENQDPQNNSQSHLTYRSRNALHHLSSFIGHRVSSPSVRHRTDSRLSLHCTSYQGPCQRKKTRQPGSTPLNRIKTLSYCNCSYKRKSKDSTSGNMWRDS